jgi:hypothetical protein
MPDDRAEPLDIKAASRQESGDLCFYSELRRHFRTPSPKIVGAKNKQNKMPEPWKVAGCKL